METNCACQADAPAGDVPQAERRPILLRAYAQAEPKKPPKGPRNNPSDVVLVFDTETTSDERQRLRFGVYRLQEGEGEVFKGIFFDPEAVTETEKKNLAAEAQVQGYQLLTHADFIEKVLLPAAYKAGGLIVGFNLPFDLSRLARSWQRARPAHRRNKSGKATSVDRSMVGGFTFKLAQEGTSPNLRVKHLSRRAAFINFATEGESPTARSRRKRNEKSQRERGYFLDLKTLAAALTSQSHSLDSLAQFLEVPGKTKFQDFDREIDAEFIRYALTMKS
jgi:hypothetical protein